MMLSVSHDRCDRGSRLLGGMETRHHGNTLVARLSPLLVSLSAVTNITVVVGIGAMSIILQSLHCCLKASWKLSFNKFGPLVLGVPYYMCPKQSE
eukprot:301876-Amphidinium_carterae.1